MIVVFGFEFLSPGHCDKCIVIGYYMINTSKILQDVGFLSFTASMLSGFQLKVLSMITVCFYCRGKLVQDEKKIFLIGSLSGPNFAIRTVLIFCFHFLEHKKKNARNVFYLVMSEFL